MIQEPLLEESRRRKRAREAVRVIGEPLLKENMSTSSMAAQTQEEQRPREDVVRVKDETDVCSLAAPTQEKVCSQEVAVHVKVESLLEDTMSTYSVAVHTTEECSREVVCEKDHSWLETASDCSVSVPQEKERPMVLVHVKVEHLLEDSVTHAQEEACSMEEVAVKEEPLWTATEATCSTQHTRENCSREEVCMKKELPLEASCYVTMTSQAEEEIQKQTATCSTRVQTQNVEEFSEEVVRVKEECLLMNAADFCGVSSAAARAGLYAGHAVKDELVVGPECLQPPDVVFMRDAALRQWRSVRHDHPYPRRASVEHQLLASRMKACRVKLERCDRLLTPRPLTEPSPSTRTNIYKCDTCAKTYPYKSDLVRHIQTHFKSKFPKSRRKQRTKGTDTIKQKVRTLKNEKSFSCRKCSKKFTRKDHLKHHNLIHERVNPHICQICNKGFRKSNALKSHGRIHTGDKPYSCDVCNKTFAHSGNLTAHQRIHMNLRPYICEICNNRFRESGTLVKHKRTHTKEKPFHCTICRKSFKQPYSLKIHQRIHSGEKPYSCDICTERFSRSDTLRYHVLAHAGKKPFVNRKTKKSTERFI